MPRRRIGQETLLNEPVKRFSPDEIAELVDWAPIERQLDVSYSAPRGEASWPPLTLFRGMLLAIWHDLSDVKLAEALDDRSSFRRFCGFARAEPTPERTAFVRFRKELLRHGLDQSLFDAITEQLKAKAIRVKTGTMVDATVVGSASQNDQDAKWSGHRSRKSVHGYKAHVGADADTALVEKLSVTPGNAHDGRSGDAALPDNSGDVYADSAYRGDAFRSAVRARGGAPRVVATHVWAENEAEVDRRLADWNGPIHQIRCRIEKIFGTWKRSYGFRRMRWRGIANATLQTRLTAIAYNLIRTQNILNPS
ncbi:MAG: IS5 family transposase [Pseudomonadota bacterium]